jgi:hypothetical protein
MKGNPVTPSYPDTAHATGDLADLLEGAPKD